MSVREALVDEIASRQGRGVQFPGRQQHLPVLTVNPIPVVVHRVEIVVRSDFLQLSERLQQGSAIPQPYVLDGTTVVLNILHEFHIAEKDGGKTLDIRVWDSKNEHLFLTRHQMVKIYEQAAMILTAYYNIETFEQIFAWHHAAGDFVVNLDGTEPSLKLITVRRYEPLFQMEDNNPEVMLNTLLIFFLNISIKLRLDRMNGVGEIAWIDDCVVEGIIKGFFKGLQLQATNALIPAAFVRAVKMFLGRLYQEEIHDLFNMIADRMNSKDPDQLVIKTHLKSHIRAMISGLRSFNHIPNGPL